MLRKGRKFYFKQKNYSNPFFKPYRHKDIYVGKPIKSRYFKFIIVLIFFVFIYFIWFLLFSDKYKIKTFEVTGNLKIFSEDIIGLAQKQAENNSLIIGSQKNIFLFNEEDFLSAIGEKYNFDKIEIKKKFPDKIFINVKEKEYTMTWLEDGKYYFSDNEGAVISEADPTGVNSKGYPLVENRGEKQKIGNKINVKKEYVDYVFKLFNEIKNNRVTYQIDRFIFENDYNTVIISLSNGPQLKFNINNDINEQFNRLEIFIKEKLKDSFKDAEYIDLRYGDRVYYE